MSQTNTTIDIYAINELVREHIDVILDKLDLEYIDHKNRFSLACPIHGGDNDNGCSLFIGEKYATPTWKCFTNSCEETYGKSLVGFVKGVLSTNKGNDVYIKQTVNWIYKALDVKQELQRVDTNYSRQFLQQMKIFSDSYIEPEFKIKRSTVRSKLEIPAKPFLKRGYTAEILDKYDVGLCTERKKEMSNRVVVPIYDDNYEWMVGCTGRSVFPECKICGLHHADYFPCPNNSMLKAYAQKWKHSYGFNASNYLYNYWFAKEHILKTGKVILTEGPADVWRLEEAGYHNSVAVFGVNLSDRQKIILSKSGAMNLILFFDPDKAGEKITNTLEKEFGHMYNILRVNSDQEPGDLNIQQIQERLGQLCI